MACYLTIPLYFYGINAGSITSLLGKATLFLRVKVASKLFTFILFM